MPALQVPPDTAHSNQLERELTNLLVKKPDSAFALSKLVVNWSLQNHLSKTLAKAYSTQGRYLYSRGDFHAAINAFFQSLRAAIDAKDKKQIAAAYSNIGLTYYDLSDYTRSTEYLLNNLKIKKELGDQKGIASAYNNLGEAAFGQGNLRTALDYYFKSLSYAENLNERKLMAFVYNNIGVVYLEQNELTQALDYYLKSLYIKEGLDDKRGLIIAYGNIGLVYFQQGQFYKSLEFHFKNLPLASASPDPNDLAACYNDIAQVYTSLYTIYPHLPTSQQDSLKQLIPMLRQAKHFKMVQFLDTAMVLLRKAHQLNQHLSNTRHVLATMNELGNVYLLRPDYKAALSYFDQSKSLAFKLHAQKEYTDAAKGLYLANKSLGNMTDALKWHEEYLQARDSLNSQESIKASLRKKLNYEYEKKNAIVKLEEEKAALREAAKLKQEKLIVIAVIFGLLITMAFSVFLYRRFVVIQKQKKLIESKNREIVDSIHYAKRIQDALLHDDLFNRGNIGEAFVLFIPKDIVSGDFYWIAEIDQCTYIAVADCTGHGVPGGFMSMLGIAFLNEITSSAKNLTPAQILDRLASKVIQQLGQTGKQGEARDGMDISLVKFDHSTNELQWAGANNGLYIVNSESQLLELKPNKQPIGFHYVQQPFTNQSLQLSPNAMVYLLTDGYPDQFGGPLGKKFKYKQLEDLLVGIAPLDAQLQKEKLSTSFHAWKGNQEQVDDICIVGFKIKA